MCIIKKIKKKNKKIKQIKNHAKLNNQQSYKVVRTTLGIKSIEESVYLRKTYIKIWVCNGLGTAILKIDCITE